MCIRDRYREGRIVMNDSEKFKGFKKQLIEENEKKFGQEIREDVYKRQAYTKSLKPLASTLKEIALFSYLEVSLSAISMPSLSVKPKCSPFNTTPASTIPLLSDASDAMTTI